MAHITRNEISEVADFVIRHYIYGEEDRRQIEWIVAEHAVYNTLMIIRNRTGSVIAVCRWNILPTGQDAHILDVVIDPFCRRQILLKRMLLKGLVMYPNVRYLIFKRDAKGGKFKKVSVKRLLQRRF